MKMSEEQLRTLSALLPRNYLDCMMDVRVVLSYEIEQLKVERFAELINFINSNPSYLVSKGILDRNDIWHRRLHNGFESARNAFMCAAYHLERLSRMEVEVRDIISKRDLSFITDNTACTICDTHKWDFEYQAFILSFRNGLDYFTLGVAAIFKDKSNSFHKMAKNLSKVKDNTASNLAAHMIEIHRKYYAEFSFVMSDGTDKSVRDTIVHYGWVDAGTVNLTRSGLKLVGGGEKLGMYGKCDSITEVLTSKMNSLEAFYREAIACLMVDLRVLSEAEARNNHRSQRLQSHRRHFRPPPPLRPRNRPLTR